VIELTQPFLGPRACGEVHRKPVYPIAVSAFCQPKFAALR